MKIFDQHVFDVAPAWARYATRNAWGDLRYWTDEPRLAPCGLHFEGTGLQRRGAMGFERASPKILRRVSA